MGTVTPERRAEAFKALTQALRRGHRRGTGRHLSAEDADRQAGDVARALSQIYLLGYRPDVSLPYQLPVVGLLRRVGASPVHECVACGRLVDGGTVLDVCLAPGADPHATAKEFKSWK